MDGTAAIKAISFDLRIAARKETLLALPLENSGLKIVELNGSVGDLIEPKVVKISSTLIHSFENNPPPSLLVIRKVSTFLSRLISK